MIETERKTETDLDQVAKNLGWKDQSELFEMIANADLSIREKQIAFKNWQLNDGTRSGFLKIFGN